MSTFSRLSGPMAGLSPDSRCPEPSSKDFGLIKWDPGPEHPVVHFHHVPFTIVHGHQVVCPACVFLLEVTLWMPSARQHSACFQGLQRP